MYGCAHSVCATAHDGGQRAALWGWSSASIFIQVLEIKLRSSGLPIKYYLMTLKDILKLMRDKICQRKKIFAKCLSDNLEYMPWNLNTQLTSKAIKNKSKGLNRGQRYGPVVKNMNHSSRESEFESHNYPGHPTPLTSTYIHVHTPPHRHVYINLNNKKF